MWKETVKNTESKLDVKGNHGNCQEGKPKSRKTKTSEWNLTRELLEKTTSSITTSSVKKLNVEAVVEKQGKSYKNLCSQKIPISD